MRNKDKYSNHYLNTVIGKFNEQYQSGSIPTLEDFSNWLNEEYEEPKILDDAERRYLRNIVLPFYDRVDSVSKLSNGNREFIRIGLGVESVMLPYFTAGTMYKNMKWQKEYTLRELDIRK
jgi:hypothetical protein